MRARAASGGRVVLCDQSAESPFACVRFNESCSIDVQLVAGGPWYGLAGIEGICIESITEGVVRHCSFGEEDWKERIAENPADALGTVGRRLESTVNLDLIDLSSGEVFTASARATAEKREQTLGCWHHEDRCFNLPPGPFRPEVVPYELMVGRYRDVGVSHNVCVITVSGTAECAIPGAMRLEPLFGADFTGLTALGSVCALTASGVATCGGAPPRFPPLAYRELGVGPLDDEPRRELARSGGASTSASGTRTSALSRCGTGGGRRLHERASLGRAGEVGSGTHTHPRGGTRR